MTLHHYNYTLRPFKPVEEFHLKYPDTVPSFISALASSWSQSGLLKRKYTVFTFFCCLCSSHYGVFVVPKSNIFCMVKTLRMEMELLILENNHNNTVWRGTKAAAYLAKVRWRVVLLARAIGRIRFWNNAHLWMSAACSSQVLQCLSLAFSQQWRSHPVSCL